MTPSDIPMDAHATPHNLVATDAADLIRQLDAAFGDMSASILAGAMEAEEARKNARVAAELARRFSKRYQNGTLTASPAAAATSAAPRSPRASSLRPAASPQPNGLFRASSPGGGYTGTGTPDQAPQAPTDHDASVRLFTSQRAAKVAERLAATHAEELLQVSLELERTKQQLEAEQMRHDETKSAWQQAKTKTASTEQHLERLLQDMETAREENGRRIDELEDDLYRATERIKTAEVEAETAMDICVQADQAKEKSDQSLQRALTQINALKEYIAQHHSAEDYLRHATDNDSERRRRVRFQVDDSAAVQQASALLEWDVSETGASSDDRPSRALVAMGRQIMQRTFSTDPETHMVSQNVIEASLERRQRLRHHLESLDAGVVADTDGFVNSPSGLQKTRDVRQHLSSAVDALRICRSVARVIKESGRRLNLSGRGFVHDGIDSIADEIHLETLAKHYTTMVEIQMEKKHKEVLGLESLVSLLEQGIG